MYPQGRHPVPLQPGQSFKFTVLETLDRIKEEFQFLQAQYHSLKLECEKLASEKTEMQRHYIMVSPITPSAQLHGDLLFRPLRNSDKSLMGSYAGLTVWGVVCALFHQPD
ncbi:transducin-like enhancer protein 2 [Stegastes partitus]|uniref:Transducin-like enhancer protein 2 n=1 Tax=Stegastes partitus TaxID=144197 RepID=A0A9Y4NGX7_9TELE|nr:PREDICTED: transducin-like enhancer protein 2 [Stegastes partitus]